MTEITGKYIGKTRAVQLYAAAGAMIGWFALILQFYLHLQQSNIGLPESILRFFSYFTILTNIMVAVSYTVIWIRPATGSLRLLTTASALTAITVYMLIVGIIYNSLLRWLWQPEGLQRIADELLHLFMPLMFLLFWILFLSKSNLVWKSALVWLWYPVAYIIYVIILGEATGFYPYPFADVSKLGLSKALGNGVMITAGFFVISLVFIAITKGLNGKKTV